MKQINEKLYINEGNVQAVQKIGDNYILITTNGNSINISQEIFDDLKEYEGGGGGGTTYTAGEGIDITDGVISNTQDPVEANPTLAGGESDLTSIQVGDVKYAIPQGTNVVANPTLVGTETDLTSVQVGETKYAIPQGTEVTANPELVGDENDLSSIQIDDIKYKIPSNGGESGTHLYQHNLFLMIASSGQVYGGRIVLSIINDRESAYSSSDDISTLIKEIYDNGNNSNDKLLLANGVISTDNIYNILGVYCYSYESGGITYSGMSVSVNSDSGQNYHKAIGISIDHIITDIVIDLGEASSGSGTEVIANPELAGTESDLTGIQVGETKYKVPSGGGDKEYLHNITFQYTGTECIFATFSLKSTQSTPMNFTDIINHCLAKGFYNTLQNPAKYKSAVGTCGNTNNGKHGHVWGLYVNNYDSTPTTINFVYYEGSEYTLPYHTMVARSEGNITIYDAIE